MRRLLSASVLFVAIVLLLPVASRLATPPCSALSGQTFATAVVLGGGILSPSTLGPGSTARTDAGVRLYERSAVETLLFTGDGFPGAPSVAELMKRRAARAGIPARDMATETRSRSTLENARFTRGMAALPVLLVTDGYHAWRSWLSFAWAGAVPDALCRAVRPTPAGPLEYLREAAAWPFNLLRAGVWSGAAALGFADRLPRWTLA